MAGRQKDPERKCLRCGCARREHDFTELRCPDGSGKLFRVIDQLPTRASQSFNREELAAALVVLTRARSVVEMHVVMRGSAIASMERKLRGALAGIELRVGKAGER